MTPAIGSFVNALSMGASLITAVAFLVLWQFKSVRLNVVALFRIVFPVVITGSSCCRFWEAAMPNGWRPRCMRRTASPSCS